MNNNNVGKYLGVIVLIVIVAVGAYFIGKDGASLGGQGASVINGAAMPSQSIAVSGNPIPNGVIATWWQDGACHWENRPGGTSDDTYYQGGILSGVSQAKCNALPAVTTGTPLVAQNTKTSGTSSVNTTTATASNPSALITYSYEDGQCNWYVSDGNGGPKTYGGTLAGVSNADCVAALDTNTPTTHTQ